MPYNTLQYHNDLKVNERLKEIIANYKKSLKEAEFKQKCDEVLNHEIQNMCK